MTDSLLAAPAHPCCNALEAAAAGHTLMPVPDCLCVRHMRCLAPAAAQASISSCKQDWSSAHSDFTKRFDTQLKQELSDQGSSITGETQSLERVLPSCYGMLRHLLVDAVATQQLPVAFWPQSRVSGCADILPPLSHPLSYHQSPSRSWHCCSRPGPARLRCTTS